MIKRLSDWLLRFTMDRYNRNLQQLLEALQSKELTILEVWDLFPGESLGWVHTFIDSAKSLGYVNDRLEPGGKERRYKMRRVVQITDLGKFSISRIVRP